MDLKEFGDYFSEIRTKEGYKSQRSLADKSGISYSTISRIELGQHKANPETLRELANCFLSVSYEELMRNAGYMDIESVASVLEPLRLRAKYSSIFEDMKNYKIYCKRNNLRDYINYRNLSVNSIISNLDNVSYGDFLETLNIDRSITLENALKLAVYYRFKFSDMFNLDGDTRQKDKAFLSELDNIVLHEKSKFGNNYNPSSLTEIFQDIDSLIAVGLESDDFIKIPIYGEIKAGYGMIGDENIIGYQMESKSRVDDGEYFYLLVKGDSMIEDGIVDGCRVLVRRQNTVPNGKIGVIIINSEEATLKRVFYDGDKVILQASNKSIAPKTYDISEVLIQGQVKSFVVDL
jgi:SOS-response transcriptional repressor LexA